MNVDVLVLGMSLVVGLCVVTKESKVDCLSSLGWLTFVSVDVVGVGSGTNFGSELSSPGL